MAIVTDRDIVQYLVHDPHKLRVILPTPDPQQLRKLPDFPHYPLLCTVKKLSVIT
jgi:hypothetical protein